MQCYSALAKAYLKLENYDEVKGYLDKYYNIAVELQNNVA